MSRGSGGAVPPRVVWEQVVEALRAAGDGTHVRRVEPVRGGMESHAFRVTTSKGAYFLKWSERLAPDRYGREARGLALLRESGAVRVPHVLAAQDVRRAADGTASAPGFFLMEWLDRPPTDVYLRRAGARLGTQVALLHRCATFWGARAPGYRRDDGTLDGGGFRADGWELDWPACYRERWLRPHVERAAQQGLLTPERRRRLERLIDRADTLLGGVERQPSLLHGDLHRGNVLCDRDGAPGLVDPNPSFGDRELELAHLEVGWSHFPPAFYSAYFDVWPPAPGREERRDLYVVDYLLGALRYEPQRVLVLDALVHRYAGA